MRSYTVFISGISVHLRMMYFNVIIIIIIIIIRMCDIYFYLKLMLFSLGRCQGRKMHLQPLGSNTMFILGILLHLDTVYLDV